MPVVSREPVVKVIWHEGATWLATESGLFVLRGNVPIPIPSTGGIRATQSMAEGGLWLGKTDGLFPIEEPERGSPRLGLPVREIGDRKVACLVRHRDRLWVGTDRGLFALSVSGGRAALVGDYLRDERVQWLEEAGPSRLLVATSRNAYELPSDVIDPRALLSSPEDVARVTLIRGEIWILILGGDYPGGLFRVEGGVPWPIQETPLPLTVQETQEAIWIGTTEGLFKSPSATDKPEPIVRVAGPVQSIRIIDGEVWAATDQRIYRGDKSADSFVPIPRAKKGLQIKDVAKVGDRIWFWGHSGAYRLDKPVDLVVRPLVDFNLPVLGVHLDRELKVEVAYELEGEPAYGSSIRSSFEAIAESSYRDIQKRSDMGRFEPVEDVVLAAGYGWSKVYIKARDEVGNTADYGPGRFVAMPPWLFYSLVSLSLLVLVLAVVPTGLVLLLAPRSRFWMKLLSSRWYRWLSLGAIYLSLRWVPYFRRRALRPYLARILTHKAFSGWKIAAKAPKTQGNLTSAVRQKKPLPVVGEVVDTTSLLRFLTWRYCGIRPRSDPLKKKIPIYCSVSNETVRSSDVGEVAVRQLKKLGGITDPRLARFLLSRGGFIYMVDTSRVLKEPEQVAVKHFVSRRHPNDFFIFDRERIGEVANELKEPIRVESELLDCVFICHSHKDRDEVEKLKELLRDALDLKADAIVATADRPLKGDLYVDEEVIRRAVHAKAFVFLVTPNSVESPYVWLEVGARRSAGRRMTPLLAPAAAGLVQNPIAGRSYLECERRTEILQGIEEVATDLGRASVSPAGYTRKLDRFLSAFKTP